MATLHVPSDETPTMFNKEAAIGAAIGSFVTPFVGTGIGALIGGYLGKNRMEREAHVGKDVKEPSFFNSGLVIGLALGSAALMLGLMLGLPMVLAGGAGGLAIGSAVGAGALSTALITAVGAGAAGLIAIGAPVIGAIAGGLMEKKSQTAEYENAQAYTAREVSGPIPQGAASAYQISPEQQAALNAAQAAGRSGAPVGQFTSVQARVGPAAAAGRG